MSPTVLSVFEHETVRLVPGGRTASGDVFPACDAASLARLVDELDRFATRTRDRYFRLGRNSITFNHHVGYVQVGDLAFEILPKADRDPPDEISTRRWKRALVAIVARTVGVKLHAPTEASQATRRWSLLEVLAAAFVAETHAIVGEGLARAYRAEEGNSSTFRGRLLVADHIRENLVRPDRFFVRFTAFDADTPVNQTLAAVARLVADLPITAAIRSGARELGGAFQHVSRKAVDSATFDRLSLDRSTARYAPALTLARLLVTGLGPSLERGATRVLALVFDMNVLWEQLVTQLLRSACPSDLRVEVQPRRTLWTTDESSRHVRADLVVRRIGSKDALLVADAKWRRVDASGKPDEQHLKQMFVYNELYRSPLAVLIHPSNGTATQHHRGVFTSAQGHACHVQTLGLFAGESLALDGMGRELAAMVERARHHGAPSERMRSLR